MNEYDLARIEFVDSSKANSPLFPLHSGQQFGLIVVIVDEDGDNDSGGLFVRRVMKILTRSQESAHCDRRFHWTAVKGETRGIVGIPKEEKHAGISIE